jgi:hypothetical protein
MMFPGDAAGRGQLFFSEQTTDIEWKLSTLSYAFTFVLTSGERQVRLLESAEVLDNLMRTLISVPAIFLQAAFDDTR